MCLIIDTNVAHRVFFDPHDDDFKDVHSLPFEETSTSLRIAYGGPLADEYFQSERIRRIILQLDRAGRTRPVARERVDAEMSRVVASGECVSDDEHVIALAIAAGVRVLVSHDQNLHADFTNPKLLANPRGKVFQTAKHRHLLRGLCAGKA